MLKDSKTGKQGACDFQLMIGSISDPAFVYSRFLSLPKNKLMRPDGKKDPKAEVNFDPVRARYEDAQMELTP
jgi:replicative DNA helicase